MSEFTGIERLVKINSLPPRYVATVNGQILNLEVKDLINFKRFKVQCVTQLGFVPELPVVTDAQGRRLSPRMVWETQYLAPALAAIETEEAL